MNQPHVLEHAGKSSASSRKFALTAPLPLMLFEGHVGVWSKGTKRSLVWFDAAEATILLHLAAGAQTSVDLADVVGAEDAAAVDALIADFVRHGVVREETDLVDVTEPVHRFYHPDADDQVRMYDVEPDAVDEAALRSIVTGLQQCPLVGENVLSDAFAGTRGFGIKFRHDAIGALRDWLPWTRAYFDLVLRDAVARQFAATDAEHAALPNAFYFNALIVPPGAGTDLHVDRTLDAHTPASHVSVLYLETVPPPGGQLFLYDGTWPVAIVHPRPGMLVHFRGSLEHGVSKTQVSSGERISLVCEQYTLPAESLAECPYLEVVAHARSARR